MRWWGFQPLLKPFGDRRDCLKYAKWQAQLNWREELQCSLWEEVGLCIETLSCTENQCTLSCPWREGGSSLYYKRRLLQNETPLNETPRGVSISMDCWPILEIGICHWLWLVESGKESQQHGNKYVHVKRAPTLDNLWINCWTQLPTHPRHYVHHLVAHTSYVLGLEYDTPL